jgi:hypothetical protein
VAAQAAAWRGVFCHLPGITNPSQAHMNLIKTNDVQARVFVTLFAIGTVSTIATWWRIFSFAPHIQSVGFAFILVGFGVAYAIFREEQQNLKSKLARLTEEVDHYKKVEAWEKKQREKDFDANTVEVGTEDLFREAEMEEAEKGRDGLMYEPETSSNYV